MSSHRSTSSTPIRTALIAAAGMLAFYAVGRSVPGDFFQRYFLEHPLERISAGMFFVGLAILLQKLWGLRSEGRVLREAQEAVSAFQSDGRDVAALEEWCQERPDDALTTQVFRRIEESLHYVRGSRRDGLEDHLRYLAELASDRLHQTYATLRTITWAIPILGFLGTVIGITMAIANVTPEQLDSSIGDVTHGLSVAFDTTALALGLSIILVFASFAVERSEQRILGDVEQFGIEKLIPWLAKLPPHYTAGNVSSAEAARQLSGFQADVWAEQLASVRSVWSELLHEHAAELKVAVDADMQQTLQLHRESCGDARDSYTDALQQSTRLIVDQVDRMLGTFHDRINAWQQAMQTSSQSSVQQSEALHDLGATFLRMAESGEQLNSLQSKLNDNLQALQVAETMERTANSLTAAVHVLTAKTSVRHAA